MVRQPSQLRLFVGVAWRAWVVTITGGFVVGLSTGLGFLLFDDDSDVVAIPGVGLIGALFGVLFGWVPAVVVAGFVVAVAVPPRSPERVVELTRWAAAGVVGVVVGWLASGLGLSGVLAMTLLPAIVLAWYSAPLTLRWFVGRPGPGDTAVRSASPDSGAP